MIYNLARIQQKKKKTTVLFVYVNLILKRQFGYRNVNIFHTKCIIITARSFAFCTIHKDKIYSTTDIYLNEGASDAPTRNRNISIGLTPIEKRKKNIYLMRLRK